MSAAPPIRLTVVMPAPVPYREPLFRGIAEHPGISLDVVYLTARPRGWDMSETWFAAEHRYRAHTLTARQIARPGRTPVIAPRGLRARLAALDPDVVVVSEFGPAALAARAWCTVHRRALVHFSELGRDAAATVPAPQRLLHSILVRHADALIGASTAARERMVADGGDPQRAFVSLQSVDTSAIRAAIVERWSPPERRGSTERRTGEERRERPRQREPRFRLLCVARLVPDKNLPSLVKACAGLRGLELHLVGDGPLRAELAALAARRGVDLRLHGALSTEEVARQYAQADAFALVSLHEPFGVALREAVAAGLPLIASRRAGAVGDVAVADRNALVVDPFDPSALAGAVGELARDPALRGRLAAGSRELDAEWPIERSVDGFLDAVQAAAAHRAPRSRSQSQSRSHSQ